MRALLLLGLLLMAACADNADPLTPKPQGTLRLATQNIHYISLRDETGPWSVGDWENRKTSVDLAFKALDADIVAFQEMESFGRGDTGNTNLARDWLLQRNPDYAAGANGDAATFPSTQPIFYRADRLEMLDQGWFFFSDTPDVIYSRTFDGSWPAFASWAQFRNRASDRSFTLYNVHFEYRSGSNRVKSAALTAQRMAPRLADDEAVVLTGDLNALAGRPTLRIFEEAGLTFVDVPGSTYHLNRGLDLFGAIDHVATAGPIYPTGTPQVQRRRFDGRYPSDHYAVVVDLVLP